MYLQVLEKETLKEVDDKDHDIPRQAKNEGYRVPSEANAVENDNPQDADGSSQAK